MHVHLRVSHEMYQANHETRGDPHHHIPHDMTNADKNDTSSTNTVIKSSTNGIAFAKPEHQAFPIIGLQHDVARHAIERSKILHATYTHYDHSPAEVIAGSLNGNKHLQVINLEQNGLTNKFCAILSKALGKQNHVIKEMNVSFNPGIGDEAEPLIRLIDAFTYAETTYGRDEIALNEEEEFNLKYAIAREKETKLFLEKMKKQEAERLDHEKLLYFSKDFVAQMLMSVINKIWKKNKNIFVSYIWEIILIEYDTIWAYYLTWEVKLLGSK